jgi:Tol biopolymer transport system component
MKVPTVLKYFFLSLVVVLASKSSVASDYLNISSAEFLGSEEIVFSARTYKAPPVLGVYNIPSDKFRLLKTQRQNQRDYGWVSPAVSSDGQWLAFTVEEKDGKRSQIAVMRVDGSALKKVTRGGGLKWSPSFSFDGQKIIFVASARTNKGRRGVGFFSIHEVDIATGNQRQLTDLEFYSILHPRYYRDGEYFIFSGDAPFFANLDTLENFSVREKYVDQFGENNIFVMNDKRNGPEDLKPILMNGAMSRFEGVSRDSSTILFLSRTNEIDKSRKRTYTYDLFISKNNEIKRVTRQNGVVKAGDISPDGNRIVFTMSTGTHPRDVSLFTTRADGTGLQNIDISPLKELMR